MRRPDSHKGDNGTVAVIGGSRTQHGAPLFSALAAEASGADLVHAWVPALHAEVAKSASLNLQVHTFGSSTSDEILGADHDHIIEFLATIDAAVIGPGLSRTQRNIKAILDLLDEAACPLVCDASALQPATLKHLIGKHAVLTPHLGELERMGLMKEELPKLAESTGCTFLVKSPIDTVFSPSKKEEISGGNAGLTVGGTGDVLAGLVAGFLAQGRAPNDACVLASRTVKACGDALFRERGFHYTAHDVIRMAQRIISTLEFSL